MVSLLEWEPRCLLPGERGPPPQHLKGEALDFCDCSRVDRTLVLTLYLLLPPGGPSMSQLVPPGSVI